MKCLSPETGGKTLTDKDMESFQDGFCGNDAIRVREEGIPKSSENDPSLRKKQALQAAIFLTKHQILERFKSKCV